MPLRNRPVRNKPVRNKPVLIGLVLVIVCAFAISIRASQQEEPPAIVGRWDVTVQSPAGNYPSWLEVKRSGYRTLVGVFVGQSGSARPISKVKFADGQLRFSVPPQWERRD